MTEPEYRSPSHSTCESCWNEMRPDRAVEVGDAGPPAICCTCEKAHCSGITVMSHPDGMPCNGDHRLTIENVEAMVAWILVDNDPELSHIRQEAVYIAVLTAIADGLYTPGPSTIARAALKAGELDFSRCY